jgi:hypothetical protein
VHQSSPARPERPESPDLPGGPALPSDVGWTGLMTAHMRAVESARPDALFHDPLAQALVEILRHAVRTDDDAYLPTGPEDLTGVRGVALRPGQRRLPHASSTRGPGGT